MNLYLSLIKETNNINITLDMMAAGSKLEVTQIYSLKRIMNGIFNYLKVAPVTNREMLHICNDLTLIDLKIFQHFVSVMFPRFTISTEELQSIYTRTKICAGTSVKNLGWNDYVAVRSAHLLSTQPYFRKGLLETQVAPYYDKNNYRQFEKHMPAEDSKQILNTGQYYPDYILRDDQWYRYYDLKAGDIKPMKGQVFITSDINKYNEISSKLLKAQRYAFSKNGDIEIVAKIDELLGNKQLSWIEKNMQLYETYEKYRTKLPEDINPSLIYHIMPKYEYRHENFPPKLYNRYTGNTNSLSSLEETRQFMIDNFANHSSMIRENYIKSEGTCKVIVNELMEIDKEEIGP